MEISFKSSNSSFSSEPDQFGNFDLITAQSVTINPRKTYDIDCGVSLDIPKNYRIDILPSPLWAAKGLVVMNNTFPDGNGSQKLSVIAHNIGPMIVGIPAGTKLAKFWFVEVPGVSLKA